MIYLLKKSGLSCRGFHIPDFVDYTIPPLSTSFNIFLCALYYWELIVISRVLIRFRFDYFGGKNSLVGVYFHQEALNTWSSHYFWCSEWVVDPLWSSIINFFIVFPSHKHCVCSLFHQELQDDDILSFLHLLTDTLLYKEKIPLDNYQFSQGTVDIRKAQYIFDSFFLFISFRKK